MSIESDDCRTACTIVVVLATWFPGSDAQSGVGELVDSFGLGLILKVQGGVTGGVRVGVTVGVTGTCCCFAY